MVIDIFPAISVMMDMVMTTYTIQEIGMLNTVVDNLKKFRTRLYNSFRYRADALLNLIDALSGNTQAKSPVELSLGELFPRQYPSVYDAVVNFFRPTNQEESREERAICRHRRLLILSDFLPRPNKRKFWLLVTDVTPLRRQFANTLKDRGAVYFPNAVFGNKPVTIGHQASVLAVLPEKNNKTSWVLPVSIERVPTDIKQQEVGFQQLKAIITDKNLPFHHELTVNVVDSAYSCVSYLGKLRDFKNLIVVARLPSNRTVYHPYKTDGSKKITGHPSWFGEKFPLKELDKLESPDQIIEIPNPLKKHPNATVRLEVWHNFLMRGKRDLPMHKSPFDLVRCTVLDENGDPVFCRPLWLIAFGSRRAELSPVDVWQSYRQRYDIEHFFRFGKQRLLMDKFQTPDTEHEENWLEIVGLACFQLWLASPLAQNLPRPWERYSMPEQQSTFASPTVTQRDYQRIIRQIGTPAEHPKPRGKPLGRIAGQTQVPRQKHKVIIKGTRHRRKKAA